MFLPARHDVCAVCYDDVARWLAGCHSRYCIKTSKPILKLFQPSGSPIISAFVTLAPIPTGNPFSGDVKYTGVGGKNWRFSTAIVVYPGNGAR